MPRASQRPLAERACVLLQGEAPLDLTSYAAQLAAVGVDTVVSDGRRASGAFDPLESITVLVPSVTVLDLAEPYIDVWPFTLARRHEPTLHPVVALTRTEAGARALQGLVAAVLPKPTSARQVLATALRVLASQPDASRSRIRGRGRGETGPRTTAAQTVTLASADIEGLREVAEHAAVALGAEAAAIAIDGTGGHGGELLVASGDAVRWDRGLYAELARHGVPMRWSDAAADPIMRSVGEVARGAVRWLAAVPLRRTPAAPALGWLCLADAKPRGPSFDEVLAIRLLGERLALALEATPQAKTATPPGKAAGRATIIARLEFVAALQAELTAGRKACLLWIRKRSRDDGAAGRLNERVVGTVVAVAGAAGRVTVYDDHDIGILLPEGSRDRVEALAAGLHRALDRLGAGHWQIGVALGRGTDTPEALVARAVRRSRGEQTGSVQGVRAALAHAPTAETAPAKGGGGLDEPLRAGMVIDGRYRLLYEIGRGGMGIVYLAEEIRLRRHVAVKVLRPEVASEETYREHFLREGVLLAAIDHPGVLPIYAIGEHAGLPFLVTPFIDGESLADRLDAVQRGGSPLPAPGETARICGDVSTALAALHEKGIVHRDVKPSNILLRRGSDRVLLCDFGVAVQLDDAALRGRLVAGTLGFIAPEVLRDPGAISPSTDIYALGAVGLCMATGANPFIGDDIASTLARQEAVAPVSSKADAHDGGLLRLLGWLVQPDPKRRPSSMLEVEEAFAGLHARLASPKATRRLPADVLADEGPRRGHGGRAAR